jgi:uncharacterized protein YjiS (DUF1127 family)
VITGSNKPGFRCNPISGFLKSSCSFACLPLHQSESAAKTGADLLAADLLEVQIMSDRHRVGGRSRPNALLAGLARLVRDHVIDPMWRGARSRVGEGELARLDDRLLRDIGLMRSQVHAAAYGRVGPGVLSRAHSMQAPPSGPADARCLKRCDIALRVDEAMAAPLARRAARN